MMEQVSPYAYSYTAFSECSPNSLGENDNKKPNKVQPFSNVDILLETIKATVTKCGTLILCNNTLQIVCDLMTFGQGYDKKQVKK